MNDGVHLSLRQFTDAWRVMCAGGPRYAMASDDGVQYVFSGCPVAFFNLALLTDRAVSSDALKTGAERASTWASTKDVPWMFVVTHEALDPDTDAAGVLDACGFAPVMPLTGMLAERVAPAKGLEDLELTVPQDDKGCSMILDVNGLAYGMELDAAKGMIGGQSFWAGHFPVLGLVAGKPACSAAVLMVDGYRYVALVATDPAQQRRGFADRAMRRALELAAEVHGERPTVLHATEAGRPVYERMGYAPISTHTVFMDKRFLTGH